MNESGVTAVGLMDRFAAARWLGIGLRTLDEHVKRGRIPSITLGRRRLFDPDQLRQWAQRQHEQAGAA